MTQNVGLGSASGYGSIHDTPLAMKGYHSRIIEKGWEKDILGDIVNTRVVAQAFDCNTVVEFLLAPNVGPWRKYEDNQTLKSDTMQIKSVQMRLCNQAYKSIKVDNALERNLCKYWNQYESGFLEDCYRQLSGMWHSFVLSAMIIEADKRNKGPNAGRHRSINLGMVGKPVKITPENLPSKILDLKTVLVNQHRWKENEMFLIVPPELEMVLIRSEYRLAADIGCCKDPSMLLDGEMPGKLVGFRTIQTSRTPGGFDEGVNKQAYYIIAFWKEAYAFYGDITEGRIMNDEDYFGKKYQMAALWGGKAIYGDAIAVGYWTFD